MTTEIIKEPTTITNTIKVASKQFLVWLKIKGPNIKNILAAIQETKEFDMIKHEKSHQQGARHVAV